MAIYDDLSRVSPRFHKFPGEFGIEIETECKKEYVAPRFSFWETHNDGSLRDFGIEYVLTQPLERGKPLDSALEEFSQKTSEIKFIPDSVTTSVHVHINFLNDTWLTFFNFCTAYTLTENLLVRYSGPSRVSNGFCLPICDSEETFRNICHFAEIVSTRKNLSHLQLSSDHNKYSALNLSSLMIRGSLEQRSFRGTTDIDEIRTWCNILGNLKDYSKSSGLTPISIVKDFDARGPEILNDMYQNYRRDISHPNENELLEKNLWYAGQIAHSVKDWSKIDSPPKEPSRKKKEDLDTLSRRIFGVNFINLAANQSRVIRDVLNGDLTEQEVVMSRLTPINPDGSPIPEGWRQTSTGVNATVQEINRLTEATIANQHRFENVRIELEEDF